MALMHLRRSGGQWRRCAGGGRALRSLCPECLNPDDLEPQDLSEVREAEPPAPGTRCPACGQVDTLRPLRPPEARTYRTCSADGYPREFCTRMVMVRYALQRRPSNGPPRSRLQSYGGQALRVGYWCRRRRAARAWTM
jgi:hypothetical protein